MSVKLQSPSRPGIRFETGAFIECKRERKKTRKTKDKETWKEKGTPGRGREFQAFSFTREKEDKRRKAKVTRENRRKKVKESGFLAVTFTREKTKKEERNEKEKVRRFL